MFDVRFWTLPGGRESLSDGGMPPKGTLPSYITALVLVRNVRQNTAHGERAIDIHEIIEQSPAPSRSQTEDAISIFAFVCKRFTAPDPDPNLTWGDDSQFEAQDACDWLGRKSTKLFYQTPTRLTFEKLKRVSAPWVVRLIRQRQRFIAKGRNLAGSRRSCLPGCRQRLHDAHRRILH